MALHILEEADRCLNCKRPLCQEGCPVHTPIPQVIQLFKERRIVEAGQLLTDNNPMSVVCSLVCNHRAQCEGHCVRGKKGTPVHFSAIEHYISDAYFERTEAPHPIPVDRRVAVVGAGPAGITAAVYLVRAGCDVTLFERKSEIGGVLYYGIPDFRLPRYHVDRYRQVLTEMGVKIRPNTTIGGALTLPDLLRDGYNAVFVATGTGRAKKLGTPGETRGNVFFGVDYLVDPSASPVGKTVAVIGVGNVAMDVARTVLRHGARSVTLFSLDNNITATDDEVEYAQLDGAEIELGKLCQFINETGPVFKNAIFDDDGNVLGYGEELEQFEADTTIICVSQAPKNKLASTTPGLAVSDNGLIVVDEDGMTSVPGLFAAGDVVLGPKTVVHSVADTKKAIRGMLRYMGLSDVLPGE